MDVFSQSVKIEQLESQLDREAIPKGELQSIAHRLNALAGTITHDTLKARYQTLCGRVHWKTVDGEIDDIFDAAIAEELDEKARSDLIGRIERIRANHALSIESRQIITAAERRLRHTEGEKLPNEGVLILPEVEAGEAAQLLYEIAEGFYKGDHKRASELCSGLHLAMQERLEQLAAALHGSLAGIGEFDSPAEYNKKAMPVVRAVIGLANELTQSSDSYPTESEVHELFSETELDW